MLKIFKIVYSQSRITRLRVLNGRAYHFKASAVL